MLAILFVAAILLITRRYRRVFKSLVNESCGTLDRFRDRKPVPEENAENQFNSWFSLSRHKILKSKPVDERSQEFVIL